MAVSKNMLEKNLELEYHINKIYGYRENQVKQIG
ncbi:hypothetical protein RSJ3_1768 [Clostridium botulinum]|nr:hypothetical protein RSJ3_1768 [Clostridium botulinum]